MQLEQESLGSFPVGPAYQVILLSQLEKYLMHKILKNLNVPPMSLCYQKIKLFNRNNLEEL